MIITTMGNIPGRDYDIIGLVQGSVVQTTHIGRQFMASFRPLVGGEVKSYTKILEKARGVAISRMEKDAQNYGATAIIGMRFATSSIMQGASEVVAYGTAVRFK